MGIFRLKLPDLGEGVVESEIVAWRVSPGDRVSEDQPIVDVMTDKATVEVGSPVDGVVLSLACAEGDVLAVGKELIRFEVKGDGNVGESDGEADVESQTATIENPLPPEKSSTADKSINTSTAQPNTAQSMQNNDTQKPVADSLAASPNLSNSVTETDDSTPMYANRLILTSPSVRRRAREAGVDISMVPGSGPEGRIEASDLETFIAAGGQQFGATGQRKRTGQTTNRLSGLRRVIAKKISASKRNIPHYSYIEEVDLTELEILRQDLNTDRSHHQPKLTLLPFIMRAMVNVLPEFPHCNANFDDDSEQLTLFNPIHIGIATMTDQGLAVPVVRHAEALDLWQAALEISRLSDAARKQQAKREELTGSTITITSLGAIGGVATTPVINAPETAIIGINKLDQRPVVRKGAIVIRTMMNLSASFDHRIVDGYDGAQLVQAIKQQLETPARLFI